MPVFSSEAEMENHFYEDFDLILDQLDENFGHDLVIRQFDVGAYGRIDLLGLWADKDNKRIVVYVIELKNGKITTEAIGQICRYRTAILNTTEKIERDKDHQGYYFDVKCILIGSGLADGDICFITNAMEDYLTCLKFEICLRDGLILKECGVGWHKPSESHNYLDKHNSVIFGEA